MKKQILIVEDDEELNDGIKFAISNFEYEFTQAYTITDAKGFMQMKQFDLIILDVNLPDGNGMDFLVEIRKQSTVSVIIVTANNMDIDIVRGLELGANDYITKPFSLIVLRARVAVQLRQSDEKQSLQIMIDNFIFDFEKMIFKVEGEPVELSKTEQKLLRILVTNRGATLTRSRLIDAVWSCDEEYVDEHALTVAVKRLRSKLGEDVSSPKYIKTVYRIGYTWALA